jgi:hypothetical protein
MTAADDLNVSPVTIVEDEAMAQLFGTVTVFRGLNLLLPAPGSLWHYEFRRFSLIGYA